MEYITIINTITTVALAFITGYYAWVTRKILKENSAQRMDGAMPFLLANKFELNSPEDVETVCIKAEISNVGKAIALNVDVMFKDPETGTDIAESNHLIPTINQGEVESDLHIHIEQELFHNIKFENQGGKMAAFLDCHMHFQDIYGRHFAITQLFAYEREDKKFVPVNGPISFDILN